ncbi:MAG: hypothetical protein GTO55_00130 [Armatimonadetes bacterium]|nr:hypothetical protein [Armatimonadota bacterium]NIM22748.1 hypothetical protein [Armatimonadota bacterium]NIM66573.1 hypothetical protein [Armatimonadota bacterium]NIM75174.1 hypothetical protein [Armatimonadota bacterium]NIN04798.1 hypothetical protein [Armatimonadota bacterium]
MPTAAQERELKRRWALHFMEDLLYEHLLSSGVAAKSTDLAEVLEESAIKVQPKFIRLSLVDSKRFIVEERRWNIALRGEIRRPFVGLVEFALRDYGKPMAPEALHNEMALVMRRPLEYFEELLDAALNDAEKYFRTEQGEWALREWLLNADFADEDEIFMRNFFFRQAEAKEALNELLDTRMATDQPLEQMAIKLLRKIGRPLDHSLLSFAIRKLREGDLDSRALFEALRKDERLLHLSGAVWGLSEWREEWIGELKKLSKKSEKQEDLPWLEEEPEEGGFVISDADIKGTITFVKRKRRAVRMKEILDRIFEIPDTSLRWAMAADAVGEALAKDGRLQRVGAQSWTIPSYVPKVDKVPRALLLVPRKPTKDETDAELEDEGLEPGLAAWVHDPRYEDIGEAEEVEVGRQQQPIDEVRYVATLPHLKAGTLKLRKTDFRFYPSEADPVCLTFRDEEIKTEVEVWASRRVGLLFGLDVWYEERGLEPGAVFTLTPGTEGDDCLLHYAEETEPLLVISKERQKILRSLKREAAKKDWPALEIMCRAMADYETGIPFLTLWAEVNAIRRTRKRTIASNLSAYHCFSQRPSGSDNWGFDERRVSLGRKKTKRHFLRSAEQ